MNIYARAIPVHDISVDMLERVSKKFITRADGCWQWTASMCRDGYGQVGVRSNGKTQTYKAHRVLYTLVYGAIPQTLVTDHLCRNRGCVNPKHIEAVTPEENIRRGNFFQTKGTHKLTCLRGHDYTASNTYISPSTGNRSCRECERLRGARRRM